MRVVIRDTWFAAHTSIAIGGGADDLVFVRCTFEGGEIHIEDAVGRQVFVNCVFQGTKFSGQPLSQRIAVECSWVSAPTETAAGR